MFNGLFNINCPPPHPAAPDQLVNTLTKVLSVLVVEMTHPECTGNLGPLEKMQLTLVSPAILGLISARIACTAAGTLLVDSASF